MPKGPKGQERPATLGMWWSIEWRGKIAHDVEEVGWARVQALTAGDAVGAAQVGAMLSAKQEV